MYKRNEFYTAYFNKSGNLNIEMAHSALFRSDPLHFSVFKCQYVSS